MTTDHDRLQHANIPIRHTHTDEFDVDYTITTGRLRRTLSVWTGQSHTSVSLPHSVWAWIAEVVAPPPVVAHAADPRVAGVGSEATIVPGPDDKSRPPSDVGNFGHDQVLVRVYDRSARVDVGIADLIVELWENGIDTDNSCEGGVTEAGTVHRPYLTGHGPLDLLKFVEILGYQGFTILHLDTAWTFGGWRAVLARTNNG